MTDDSNSIVVCEPSVSNEISLSDSDCADLYVARQTMLATLGKNPPKWEELTPEQEAAELAALKPVVDVGDKRPPATITPETAKETLGLLLTDLQGAKELTFLRPDGLRLDVDQVIAATAILYLKKYGQLASPQIILGEAKNYAKKNNKAESFIPRLTERLYELLGFIPGEHRQYYVDQARQLVYYDAMGEALHTYNESVIAHNAEGITKAKEKINAAEAILRPNNTGDRSFCDANAVLDWPDMRWLVEGLLPENGCGMVFGLPGCWKTFFALDMALSLAHGLPFMGRFNVPNEAPVAYITPEGTSGLKARLKGWMQAKAIDKLRNTQINKHAFRLNEPDEVREVITQIVKSGTKPRLLVIDTLARNFSADENSTKDMSLFVNNVMDLGQQLNLAILIVHHSGKETSKGARGSIALTGACDFSIEMTKDSDESGTVRCKKMKDAPEFKPFTASPVQSGPSMVLKHEDGVSAETKAKEITFNDFVPVLSHLPQTEAEAAKVAQIVAATLVPDATVRRHLAMAMKYGWVNKATGPLRYWLSDDGKAKLAGQQLVEG